MIKAVLFDLDGTLYDRDRLAAELFAQQYALFAHELAGISEDRFMRDVTNGGSEMQRRKLVGLGLQRSFDVILVSEEEGVRKPDAEIFRRALTRLDVAAHEALFVGDHPVAEVEGAHRAGLLAVWKFVPYWPPVVPTAPTVRAISEVLQLL